MPGEHDPEVVVVGVVWLVVVDVEAVTIEVADTNLVAIGSREFASFHHKAPKVEGYFLGISKDYDLPFLYFIRELNSSRKKQEFQPYLFALCPNPSRMGNLAKLKTKLAYEFKP